MELKIILGDRQFEEGGRDVRRALATDRLEYEVEEIRAILRVALLARAKRVIDDLVGMDRPIDDDIARLTAEMAEIARYDKEQLMPLDPSLLRGAQV